MTWEIPSGLLDMLASGCLLHALHHLHAPNYRQFTQPVEHFFPARRGHFEVNPRALRRILQNRNRSDIAIVFRHHARHLMQNAGAGSRLNQQSMFIRVHLELSSQL